jgi:hypothetical protein
MKVIVPCCGRSSRFPNLPPKYMLPGHDGRPMLALSLAKIAVSLDDVVIAVLREHEEKYGITKGFELAFGRPLNVVIHDEPTRSQSETVALTLQKLKLNEPFLIKDSDNCFAVPDVEQSYNYICVDSLNNFDSINPRNKSYLQTDHRGQVTNIREKVVISDLFNVGGYYFTDAAQFLSYYDRLSSSTTSFSKELYLSDVIGAMILDGIPFRAQNVTGYEDWGTITEWRRALLAKRSYLVMIDGLLFERGSAYFRPRFNEVKPNQVAIDAISSLASQGNTIQYLSIRPEAMREITEKQLLDAGAPAGKIFFDCPVASNTIVGAPHETLPFTTVHAIELSSEDPHFIEKLRNTP